MKHCLLLLGSLAYLTGCATAPPIMETLSFGDDLQFLRRHTDVIVLSDASEDAQVAVVPAWQGRVMTSTAGGLRGGSYGWINYDLVASGEFVPHMNAFGGEDRFWMGPEGGQFAIFFPPEAPFDMENWQTPPVIDSEPFELVSSTDTRALFRRDTVLRNRAGEFFEIRIERTIRLLNALRAEAALGIALPASVRMVAYESENDLTNTGNHEWSKDSGLLSIWILGMFRPSPGTTVVIPFEQGPEATRGAIVNDNYFGKVPADRLLVGESVLYFRGDGLYRSKIGLSPSRAKQVLGSYNEDAHVLTIVTYTKPEGVIDYVNSMWEIQSEPFGGDVVNSYNDGPLGGGAKQLGPFYELETSSPAYPLKPRETLSHTHRTFHFEGPEEDLDQIARATLGVALESITSAF